MKITVKEGLQYGSRYGAGKLPLQDYEDILSGIGFRRFELLDIDGKPYDGRDCDTYWLWLCAYK